MRLAVPPPLLELVFGFVGGLFVVYLFAAFDSSEAFGALSVAATLSFDLPSACFALEGP